ncbi:THAP domain-containing protein 4 [Arapaima gigas]
MVISCAAVNCTNRQGKVDKTEVSFHRFPIHNPRRLAKWQRAVRRENWAPNKYSFLCSTHFTADCFLLRCEDQHRQLKASAVPTIFDFTPKDRSTGGHVRKKVLSMKVQKDEKEVEEEEEVLVSCRSLQTPRGPLKEMSMTATWGEEDVDPRGSELNPIVTGNLPPQDVTGEWALDGGKEEVFTPSSRNLIDALHSYSSTSRQEREGCSVQHRAQGEVHTVNKDDCHPLCQLSQESRPKINSKHRHCRPSKSLVQQLQRRAKYLRIALLAKRFRTHLEAAQDVPLNPAILPLDWLLGSWESDEPGEGSFPTIKPFRYTEMLHFSHVGQPVINFMFNAYHSETKKPLHRECGFIRIQPGTNRVAFIIAQNSGLVEIEEGELSGQQMSLQSCALARTSFAKEPHVRQIFRVFQLRADGKLEQVVSMATDDQPLTQHLNITYRRCS